MIVAMTAAQIAAELQRKKNAGIAPTNQANMATYNKLTAQPAVKTPTTTTAPKPTATTAPAAQKPPADQTAIRQFLNNRGVTNDAIGYSNGQVTVNGTGFISPTTNLGGTTYATNADLDKAYSQYQMNQGQNKLNNATGAYEKAINTPYEAYTPAQAFTYNQNTDPAYQAALQSALANAQTAQNNAMVNAGRMGVGNSSSAITAANQIQQNAYGAVTRDVLPQLIQQAYQRYADQENMRYQQYMDQYGMSRDHVGDLGNLINIQSGLNQQLSAEDQRRIDNAQQQWNNRFNYGQAIGTFGNGQQTLAKQDQVYNQKADQRNYDRGVLESDRNYDRGVLESDRNYNRGVLESDRTYGLQKDDNARQWASYNLSKSNSNADNSRASSSQGFNQLMDIWRASGVAPAGIPGVQQGTPYGGQQQAQQDYDYRTDPSFAEDVAAITSNPSTALAEVQNNAKQIISTYGYDAYLQMLKLATPEE